MSASADRAALGRGTRIDGNRVRIVVAENVSIFVDFAAHHIEVDAPDGVPIHVDPEDSASRPPRLADGGAT